MTDLKAITVMLAHSYDRCALEYKRFRESFNSEAYLDHLLDLTPESLPFLDAGCGSGTIISYLQLKGREVYGIDISQTQLRLAQEVTKTSHLALSNILTIPFPAELFGGLTCFYTLFHIPREYHLEVFKEFNRVLAPGGTLLVTLRNKHGYEKKTEEFLGNEMFWSYYDVNKTLEIAKEAGFTVRSIVEENTLNQYGETEPHSVVFLEKIISID